MTRRIAILVGATVCCIAMTAATAMAGTNWASGLAAGSNANASGAKFVPPTNVTAGGPTTTSLDVGWTAPSGTGVATPTSYTVLRCSGTNCTPSIAVPSGSTCTGAITGTSCTDTGLSPSTSYTYAVRSVRSAWNTTSTSGPSQTTSANTASPTSVTISNSGSIAGRPENGDTITVVYNGAIDLSKTCPTVGGNGWSHGTGTETLGGPNAQVVITKGAGNDLVSFADSDCDAGGANLGSVDLGQTGYVSATAAFGTSDSTNCNGGHPTGASCTTLVWTTATKTLVITLGKLAGGTPSTRNTAVVATYSAGSNSGFSGTKATASAVQF